MVELTLLKNSRMTVGKIWPKPAGANNIRKVQIYRWNPDDGKNPSLVPISLIWTTAARWFWTR